jgi:formylglycine-generating enzyme required for sulfatase activity
MTKCRFRQLADVTEGSFMLVPKPWLPIAAAIATLVTYSASTLVKPSTETIESEMITLRAGRVTYPPAGDFTRSGNPVNAPLKTVHFSRGLQIMKHQVSQAEYWKCVEDQGCPSASFHGPASADAPMVDVSWRDAQAYAIWYSGKTAKRYRLPTDEEWAFAAGSHFRNEGWPDADSSDPAQRWLARYESEFADESIDNVPRAIGSFGANENGLLDVAGNVWEWTDSCFVRIGIRNSGEQTITSTNCGVRVVEGRHRTYVSDFIREARSGGCAVGKPPANLGFRLVRAD